MNLGEAITSGFRNYVNFSGRAARPEFWYWFLFTVIVAIVAGILDRSMFGDDESTPMTMIANLILVIPSVAIGVRRLHDIDRSGWWYLIVLTIIGVVLLIYWACQPGTPGPNRFGPQQAPTG